MQELRDLLTQTAQIANSNAKAIQANSQSIADLRDAVKLSFDDILGLNREIAIQQQKNTQGIANLRVEIGNLRAVVQDWITQDRNRNDG
ncbi:hypothetical protein IFO70_36635 [Phormidium tenue FACHB-886]|nr:hypothetical protein [Phormidium tenue FACHB-886]